MKFQFARLAGTTMVFKHLLAMKDGTAQYVWYYEGMRAGSDAAQKRRA
jgi:hypothetical protein